jgi:hypothetical protein
MDPAAGTSVLWQFLYLCIYIFITLYQLHSQNKNMFTYGDYGRQGMTVTVMHFHI